MGDTLVGGQLHTVGTSLLEGGVNCYNTLAVSGNTSLSNLACAGTLSSGTGTLSHLRCPGLLIGATGSFTNLLVGGVNVGSTLNTLSTYPVTQTIHATYSGVIGGDFSVGGICTLSGTAN